jgi:hypothetical protein
MKTVYEQLTVMSIEQKTMDNFYQSCLILFDCPWSRYAFTHEEMDEILTRSMRFYDGPNPEKRKRAWATYVDLIGHMVLARKIVNQRALVGFCVLNNLLFDWEDNLCSLQTIDEMVNEIETIVKDYFPENFQRQVYTSWVNAAYCYYIDRKYNIKEKVCNDPDELYHFFRLSDAGIIPFLIALTVVYEDRDLLYITAQEYVSGLGMKPFMHVNDVFSFNKEINDKELANEVVIRLTKTAISTETLLQDLLNEIEISIDKIKELFPELYPVFIFWLRGNLEWSYITYRYHDNK